MASAPLDLERTIVLVGLMGVGKTTVGRRLAVRLGLDFVDSDHEIEQAAGCSVSEIFERFGEPEFRDGERRVIARLIEGTPKVVATGGGAFMNAETRALILNRCIAIWLDADVDTLVERVARRDTRPLLKGKDPAVQLRKLAAERNPIYAEAHLHIRSQRLPHERTVEKILDTLASWSPEDAAAARQPLPKD
jgi:shikimate kinase